MIESPYGNHLPIFPTFYNKRNEEIIETTVERLVNRADRAFMAGQATQTQYTAWYNALCDWADSEYAKIT